MVDVGDNGHVAQIVSAIQRHRKVGSKEGRRGSTADEKHGVWGAPQLRKNKTKSKKAGKNSIFGGMPGLTEFYDDISAIWEKATNPQGEPMTIANDTKWGNFEEGQYIVGQKSGAKALISKIVKTEAYEVKKTISTPVKLEDAQGNITTTVFKSTVAHEHGRDLKKLDIEVKIILSVANTPKTIALNATDLNIFITFIFLNQNPLLLMLTK